MQFERLDQLGNDLAGKLACGFRRGLPLHDGKFVAAEPRYSVASRDDALQPFGDRAKQRIPH